MAKLHTYSRHRKSNTSASLKSNFYLIGYLLTFFAVLILIQAFRWQVIQRDQFTALANQNTEKERQATSRGVIYASDGTVLAIDQPAWGIYYDLSQIPEERELFFKNKDKYVATVSGILGMEKF
jgi:cell division protein FtsI/penicillin-binding protein 2